MPFAPKLSKDDIKQEILKCGKDPVYFITNYCSVVHPTKGVLKFNLFPFQKTIVNDFKDYRHNIVLKGRQLGVSTVVAAFALWLMLFNRGKSIIVVATKESKAVNVVRKSKFMYKKLPGWLKISALLADNRNSFELENASWMKGITTSEDAGRSEALSLLIIDEAAIIKNLEVLWPGLYNTVSAGGKCILLSTPRGAAGKFYQLYIEAQAQQNDFHPSMYKWDVHPDRDQEWFEHECRNMSKRDIAEEHLCDFAMSGMTVFDNERINWIENTLIKEPAYKTAFDRNLWVWEEYQPGSAYFIAADCSRGDAEDYSVAHVFRLQENKLCIVAEYQGKATPDLFANFLYNLGNQYNHCLLVVENNSVGYAVIDKLISAKYPAIYYSEKSTHDFVDSWEAEGKPSAVPGFTTTSKTRPLVIAKMEEFLRNDLLHFYSTRMLNECKTFIWNGARAEAQKGYHDDLVMACAIGCYIREMAFEVNAVELQYKKAFLDAMFVDRTTFNGKIAGQRGAPPSMAFDSRMKEYEMFSWMYTSSDLKKNKKG